MRLNEKLEQYCVEVKLETDDISMQLQGIYDRMLEDVLKNIDETCKNASYTTFDANYISTLRQKLHKDIINTFGK